MLVQKIVDFYTELGKEKVLINCDKGLLKSIIERFSGKKTTEELSNDDWQFLRECYNARWQNVKRTIEDYTLSASSVNQKWVNLAKVIAAELDISYLSILFYDVTNTHDPADGSWLTETTKLTNFYLNDENQLCRKRVLYDRMKEQNYMLCSTDITGKILKIVTIAELHHLQRCKQESGKFSILYPSKTEEFDSFWDFLTKESFPRLTFGGGMPIGLLPHLIEVIEDYYTFLKAKDDSFHLFKDVFQRFVARLYQYPLSNVNYLYGQKVRYKEKDQYLLDVFIAIFQANTFTIDEEIMALTSCLFKYSPILKANSNELRELYSSRHAPADNTNAKYFAYERCCSIYISLFATEFKMWTSGQSISCWDIVNTIPSELGDIYKLLHALFNKAEPDFIATYDEIINEYVVPKSNSNGFFSQCMKLITRNKATATWLDLVEHKNLAQLGSYWFEPPIILYALLAYNKAESKNQKLIDSFLDELIHTYSQDKPAFAKALRVNILFSKFLSSLEECTRRHLIIWLTLTEPDTETEAAKIRFNEHCTSYIVRRITSMGYRPPSDAADHYTEAVDKDSVIDVYNKLNLKHLESNAQKNIQNYFSDLHYPILTADQLREIEDELRVTVDPIGAYT